MTVLNLDALTELQNKAQAALEDISTIAELEQWRVEYIGRKGQIPNLLRQVKDLPPEERGAIGQAANTLRIQLEGAYTEKRDKLTASGTDQTSASVSTQSSQPIPPGHLHPLTAALRRARLIFASMGFLIVEGPDVDEALYNFDNLNIPKEHPARAETDTFYLKDLPDLVLRTHVSTLQSRAVKEHNLKPPFRLMYYGSTYRSEKEDPTHLAHFQQYEFMVVDESVNLVDFKQIVETFFSLFFGRQFEVAFRPSYYPFVEPGLDVAIRDKVTGKGGWLEMAGAGSVHPNVLRNIGIDPDKYQGIALGGGLDRLAMLKHNIPDARLMYSGDMRFLKQFS